jgi:hypothetical protein
MNIQYNIRYLASRPKIHTYRHQLNNVLLEAKLQEIYTKVSQSTQKENERAYWIMLRNLLQVKFVPDNPTGRWYNQYLMGLAFHWHGESCTKPKVCNLQYPFFLSTSRF